MKKILLILSIFVVVACNKMESKLTTTIEQPYVGIYMGEYPYMDTAILKLYNNSECSLEPVNKKELSPPFWLCESYEWDVVNQIISIKTRLLASEFPKFEVIEYLYDDNKLRPLDDDGTPLEGKRFQSYILIKK